MFSHVMIGSNDLDRSKRFYDALLAATGGKPGREDAAGPHHLRAIAAVSCSSPSRIDGAPASCSNGGTIGFTMENSGEVEAWHKAGIANGGAAIEDPPGVRQGSNGPLYLAYLRDPDDNKLCAVYRMLP